SQGLCELSRIARVAPRDGLALRLVARQQIGAGFSPKDGRKLPAEIYRILDGGVVAEPARRREQMRRIAGEEHPAALKTLGHQGVAGDPCAKRQDLGA